MPLTHKQWYYKGLKDGIPIGLGYFAVALAMGIAARNAGLTAIQATVTSLLINASAGQYVGFTLLAARAGLLEVALMEAVSNARYLLMSCALSQKLAADTPSSSTNVRLLNALFFCSIGSPSLIPRPVRGAICGTIPADASHGVRMRIRIL